MNEEKGSKMTENLYQ